MFRRTPYSVRQVEEWLEQAEMRRDEERVHAARYDTLSDAHLRANAEADRWDTVASALRRALTEWASDLSR